MTHINIDYKAGQTDEDYMDCWSTDDSDSFDMYKLLRELGHNEDECSYMWAYQDLSISLP